MSTPYLSETPGLGLPVDGPDTPGQLTRGPYRFCVHSQSERVVGTVVVGEMEVYVSPFNPLDGSRSPLPRPRPRPRSPQVPTVGTEVVHGTPGSFTLFSGTLLSQSK